MKTHFLILIFWLSLSSLLICCHLLPNKANNGNNNNNNNNGNDGNTSPSTNILFTAFGTEPFWSVRIAESGIRLTALRENVDTVLYPFVAAESVVGRPKDFAHIFRVTDAANPITIVLKKNYGEEVCRCNDGMSDNTYDYDATVILKDHIWMGCGRAGE